MLNAPLFNALRNAFGQDPDVANDRIRRIVESVAKRTAGGRARRLCVDATSERYFAVSLQKLLRGLIPVELVIASVTIDRPGYGSQTMKQILGTQMVDVLDNNRLTLPPDKYVRIDWRLVKKEKGLLYCEPDQDGKHGDTFDSTKLSIHALASTAGVAKIDTEFEVGGTSLKTKHRDPRDIKSWVSDETPRERHMAV